MCAKLIEKCGITNGVYRHSGMSTNVQKIRYCTQSWKFEQIVCISISFTYSSRVFIFQYIEANGIKNTEVNLFNKNM